jgi:hypothetical protein
MNKDSGDDQYRRDQLYRRNKWGLRVIRRDTDYNSAQIVKCTGFPDEVILARAMWPGHARAVVDEHNDAMAKALFPQNEYSTTSG